MNYYESWCIKKSGRFPIVCLSWILIPIKGSGVFDTDAMFYIVLGKLLCFVQFLCLRNLQKSGTISILSLELFFTVSMCNVSLKNCLQRNLAWQQSHLQWMTLVVTLLKLSSSYSIIADGVGCVIDSKNSSFQNQITHCMPWKVSQAAKSAWKPLFG